ncbi:hypothetical protein [Nocardia beijingensis]|uniref:hypothetical protein n=1 Tax=Nocardia beijingensis TaxID=95162 RepID=UPI000AC5A1D8|nr:hypothetical protein [Nocardia beijingensis]
MTDDADKRAERLRQDAQRAARLRQEAADRQRGRNNNTRGEYFHRGMAQIRGETRESGWVREHREDLPGGKYVKLDQARVLGGEKAFSEYKSGRVDGKARDQLAAHRYLLEKGIYRSGQWVTVKGEVIAPEIRTLIEEMARDLEGKFQHVEVSREMAVQAIGLGETLTPGKTMELPGVGDKARAQQHAIERIENRARDTANRFREIERFHNAADRGRAEAAHRARETAERAQVERVAAERVALEFPVPGLFQEREAVDTGEQVAREAADAASLERAAADARTAEEKAREDARIAREAADKERAEELARLQARGVPPEVVKLLGLGQAQPPSAAVREPPGHAPGVVRGGTGQGQERSRGITRDR